MKPGLMIIAILASVVAGAGGGYVATHLAGEKAAPAPRPVVATQDFNTQPAPAPSVDLSDELARLRVDMAALSARLDRAPAAAAPDKDLAAEIAKLNKRIAGLESGTAVAHNDSGSAPAPAVDRPLSEFDAAVEAAIERRQQAEAARQAAEREERMAAMVEAGNRQILERLSTDLNLTEAQKVNISAVLTDYATKRGEVFRRGGEAREAGIEFDWGAEMGLVHTAAADSVRAELVGNQLSEFNELIGERSLDRLAGGGRFGGQGGGRGPGRR